MTIHTKLFLPGFQVVLDSNVLHRFFTVHGTTMLFLWAVPIASGLNYLVPIMIRYKDMAWPKLNAVAFLMMFVGVTLVFVTQHILGLYGMPRRVADYVPADELIIMNQISTVGAWIIGAAMVIFVANLIKSAGSGKLVDRDDPFQVEEKLL